MCVGSVCVHIHLIIIKIHPVFFFFFYAILKYHFSSQAVLRFLSEWRRSVQTTPTLVDWQGHLTLDPPWVCCHHSTILSTPVKGKRLRCSVVGFNNEYSSHHLLPTSEPLKTQRINVTFALKWMRRSPICLNVCMFTQIIPDPAHSNNVLVSQFRG